MAKDFQPFTEGFGKKRFNRLLRLIEKYRTLPARPGWEQTENGVMPPPIIGGTVTGSRHPFLIAQVNETDVTVTPGKCHYKGSWTTPTWEGGDAFDTDKEITSTAVLWIRVDIAAGAGTIGSDALKIGWDLTAPSEALPSRQYDIDFTGESITETIVDGQVRIKVGTVTITSGEISDIEQDLNYSPVLPWQLDIPTSLNSGGT